ncbi:response regulator [Paenibacillus piscarius]|uniref:response regulator n=1 Tax=Paenibacillus piscarius TaxID=1089681 RepID=UPI001EE840A5|nr:response regulator [Paenibacillus piscarius]
MYRMLIVDDEEIITDGLAVVFGKMDLGLDLYKAYSGREALELLDRTRVDIVLSDICMPEMDGMELMEHIRRRWPQCKLVFLTGHSDFNYVYQAIQAPGVQYVLKNEGYPKLIEAVKRSLQELQDTMQANDLIREAKEQLNTLETLAQGGYFRHLIHSVKVEQDVAEDFERLRIPLDASAPVLLALGSLTDSDAARTYTERQETALAVKFLSEKLLKERTVSLGVIDRFGDLIWLIQPDGSWAVDRAEVGEHGVQMEQVEQVDQTEQIGKFLEGTFELIQQTCQESLGVTVAITLSAEQSTWAMLPGLYDKVRQVQHYRAGDGERMVQRVHLHEAAVPDQVRDRFLRDKAETLAAHLEAGRKEDFLQLFREMAEPAGQECTRGNPYLTELYYTIALMLMSYINRWEADEGIATCGLMNLEAHRTWGEAFRYLEDTAGNLFSVRKSGEQKRAASVIDRICLYIEENLDQDLSLVRLADVIHFNPSYLSRLFKQERGINLSEYIEELRVRQAKELLRQGELKVAEVGSQIGYVTPQSFTRVFKKWTGTTPQEYRTDVVGG